MNSLFGLELPAPVNFIIAFVVVLALIAAATWAVRRFGAGNIEAMSRSRQPRLAVIESAPVDGRRRLVIVRRDNAEHLLMIGGPTDVVVETNIVRTAAAAARDQAAPATRSVEPALPRAMPLPDPTAWPLAPAPAPATAVEAPVVTEPPPAEKPRVLDEPKWPPAAEPPAPPSSAPAGWPTSTEIESPAPAEAPAIRVEPVAPRPAAPAPAPAIPAAAIVPDRGPGDANLAEMAQRLEAALRRPPAQAENGRAASARRIEPKLAARPQTRPAPPIAARDASDAPQHEADAAAQVKTEFENLEQEMASLLGRPSSGKT